jgi:hypothetical protein
LRETRKDLPLHMILRNQRSRRRHIGVARFYAPISIVHGTWWARGAKVRLVLAQIISDFVA